MKILVYSDNYPSGSSPLVGTFVYKFVQSAIKNGAVIKVISPATRRFSLRKTAANQFYGNELASVLRPKVWSFSSKWILRWNTFNIYRISKVRSLAKNLKIDNSFDALYCHFLSNALIAAEVNLNNAVPIIAAVGEYRNIDVIKSFYNKALYEKLLQRINGFIAVSEQVKIKLLSMGVSENSIIVLPNATDRDIFRPLDKNSCREKFGIPHDKKVVLFIGRFIDNKGPLRLLEAVKRLNDPDVLVCFIGKGQEESLLISDQIILKKALPYFEIPEIMSAADLFVLPTLHEGSSNVLVEAMACGLPIVSSDIPEVIAQCDDSFSTLVDPMDVNQIKKAIKDIIYNEDKLADMKSKAILFSEKFDLDARTRKVLDFIKSIK